MSKSLHAWPVMVHDGFLWIERLEVPGGWLYLSFDKSHDMMASSFVPSPSELIAAAPELLEELKAAHQIIMNALNIMSADQKNQWSEKNERDGVKDGWALTRVHKREATIAKATGGCP